MDEQFRIIIRVVKNGKVYVEFETDMGEDNIPLVHVIGALDIAKMTVYDIQKGDYRPLRSIIDLNG